MGVGANFQAKWLTNSRIRTLTICPNCENNPWISSLVTDQGRLPTKMVSVSDSCNCSWFSLNTSADSVNVREDTASLSSELGAATGARALESALRVRVAGKTVRRPRRACEQRVLANILRDARAAVFRSSLYHVPYRFLKFTICRRPTRTWNSLS